MALVQEGIWFSSFLGAFADFCDFNCVFFLFESFAKLNFTCFMFLFHVPGSWLCVLLAIFIWCLAPDVIVIDMLVSIVSEKSCSE